MKSILARFVRQFALWFRPAAFPAAGEQNRPQGLFEALEARVLFSGAPVDPEIEAADTATVENAQIVSEGDGYMEANGVAVDSSGNVYVAGSFRNTHDFVSSDASGNAVELSSTDGSDDAFITKYDADGGLLWAKSFGSSYGETAYDIDVDGSGNVYVTGEYSHTVDFDTDPSGVFNLTSSGNIDAFIAKFDTNGNFLWAKSFGGAEGSTSGEGIDVDDAGTVVVAGEFIGYASDGSGNSVSAYGGSMDSDAFVAKLDTNGNFEWAASFGGNRFDQAHDVAVDGSGNALIIGRFSSEIAFDASGNNGIQKHGNPMSESTDVFVAKFDGADGRVAWARAFGSSGWDRGSGIDVDSSNNAYITGTFYGSASFDSDPSGSGFTLESSEDSDDVFVAKLDADGNTQWAVNFEGAQWGDESGNDIFVDDSHGVYVTGNFYGYGGADFDPDPSGQFMLYGDFSEGFVAKLDTTDGNFRWAAAASGSGAVEGEAIAVDGSGNVFVVGSFYGTVDFDPDPSGEFLVSEFYGGHSGDISSGFIWKLSQIGGGPVDPPPFVENTVFVDEDNELVINGDDGGDDGVIVKVVGGNVVISTGANDMESGDGATTNGKGDIVVPVGNLTGIVINTGSGADKITIGALGNLTGNLTINGGDGIDKINLGGSTSVSGDVDIDAEEMYFQNGNLTAGGDLSISATDGGNGTAAGGVDALSLQNFDLSAGGNLTLEGQGGNGTAAGASGNAGIVVSQSSAVSAGGDITVRGTGGQSPRGGNHGVVFYSASSLATTGAGSILIEGTGGTGGNGSFGVYFAPTGSSATVVDGTLTIRGTGGAGGSSTHGLEIGVSTILSATGTGSIEVQGTGGGGNGTTGSLGMLLKSAQLTTVSGDITLSGISGVGKNTNIGIDISGNTSVRTTAGGNIELDGTSLGGVGNGTDNMGVRINTGTSVQVQGTGSSGTVTIDGTGGTASATNNNHGVLLNSTQVKSVNGDLTINGTAGGSGNTNRGVAVQTSTVETTGTGAVSITGTGTQNASVGNSNDGVYINTGAGKSVKTASGNLTITGNGGKGTNLNYGIRILTSTVTAGGSGVLSLIGTASSSTGTINNVGVHISGISVINGGTGSKIAGTGGGGTTGNHGVSIVAATTTTSLTDTDVTGTAGGTGLPGSQNRVGKFTP